MLRSTFQAPSMELLWSIRTQATQDGGHIHTVRLAVITILRYSNHRRDVKYLPQFDHAATAAYAFCDAYLRAVGQVLKKNIRNKAGRLLSPCILRDLETKHLEYFWIVACGHVLGYL
jgi:hypothetical protein